MEYWPRPWKVGLGVYDVHCCRVRYDVNVKAVVVFPFESGMDDDYGVNVPKGPGLLRLGACIVRGVCPRYSSAKQMCDTRAA